jgi:hypothetical protein
MVAMALPAVCSVDPAVIRERSMLKVLRFLRNWSLLSIPLGLFIGRFIKVGKGPPLRDEDRR